MTLKYLGVLQEDFPVDALPSELRCYALAISETHQVPVDLPACLMLAVCAAPLAKVFEVQGAPGWIEPCNLYVVSLMPPASRKSAVFKLVTKPIEEAEKRLRKQLLPEINKNRQQARLLDKQIKSHERGVSSGGSNIDQVLYEIEKLKEKYPKDVRIPRLLVDDITPEELGSQLSDHGERMALMSAEGGIFDTIAGRYSNNTPNLDVFLKGHSGDTIRVDRKGRDSDYVEKPALTIGLAVQPDVIANIANNKKGFLGRGLLGRFLYSLPASNVGFREISSRPIDPRDQVFFENALAKLYRLQINQIVQHDNFIHVIKLSREANQEFVAYRKELEIELRPGEIFDGMEDWGGKLAGAVLRIAAILHSVLNSDAPHKVEISKQTVMNAIEIGHYFKSHALAAYSLMGANSVLEDNCYFSDWLVDNGIQRFTFRQAHQALRGRFKTASELKPIIRAFKMNGFLEEKEASQSAQLGRKPGPSYIVTEKFHSHYSQN